MTDNIIENSYLNEPAFSIKLEYVYLIREREHIRQSEQIYKIGKTTQVPNSRLAGYPKGSEVYMFMNVKNCTTVEDEIIRQFDIKFQQKPENGREYYSGDVCEMMESITHIANICNNKNYTKPESSIVNHIIYITGNNNNITMESGKNFEIRSKIDNLTDKLENNEDLIVLSDNTNNVTCDKIVNIVDDEILDSDELFMNQFIEYIKQKKPKWYTGGSWMFINDLYEKFNEKHDSSMSINKFSRESYGRLFIKKEVKYIDKKQGRAVLLFKLDKL